MGPLLGRRRASIRALLGLSWTVACGGATSEDPEGDARAIWETRCATCHGAGGQGDGPAGLAISPRPRDFTDRGWQEKTDDRQVRNAILYGGEGVGLNRAMAANPDLRDRPDVTEALVGIVRAFGVAGAARAVPAPEDGADEQRR